jgi:hypothetical protein
LPSQNRRGGRSWSCIGSRSRFLRAGLDQFRRSLLLFALHEDREEARKRFGYGRAAAIGRAEPVAADALDAEASLARAGLAERLLADPDLEPGKIRQLAGEARLALGVGQRLLAEELAVEVALVIAADQNQMKMGERLAALSAENAKGDGLAVGDWEALVRAAGLDALRGAAEGSGRKSQSNGKRKCDGSDHKSGLREPIGAAVIF